MSESEQTQKISALVNAFDKYVMEHGGEPRLIAELLENILKTL